MEKKVKLEVSHHNFFKKNRGATILAENIIFIVLNLIFLAIIMVFLYSKMGDAAPVEERYAKEIALIIDSAKPGMEISINMQDALNAKDKDWGGKIVTINGNTVTVQLREDGGYSYSFFNDVDFDYLYYPHEKDDDSFFNFEVLKK